VSIVVNPAPVEKVSLVSSGPATSVASVSPAAPLAPAALVTSTAPATSPASVASPGPAHPLKKPPRRKILVVDDSPTERYVLFELLSKRGYEVIEASNGEEAVVKARTEKPYLVLMDVVMPGTSGYQATRALSRDPETQSIPVIMCTSKGAETDQVWGLRQGARDYLVKPIDPEELLAKIASFA
jgi:twitching motility two-component system response regulator PilH